jgi:hypothetical protein
MMIQPMPTIPKRHPGLALREPARGDDSTMFDELQRSLVEQRMTSRLAEAGAERLGRIATADHHPTPMRTKLGHALIGLGRSIAGPFDEPAATATTAANGSPVATASPDPCN